MVSGKSAEHQYKKNVRLFGSLLYPIGGEESHVAVARNAYNDSFLGVSVHQVIKEVELAGEFVRHLLL